ncbi:hypothetical protein KKE34_00570 [Patescibacteria group bacterium]|nr:hypothetical protein [Patescibacteria group bacterium]MBU1885085.1 hypothetical protein [Patescibacteria group bacterium]
MAKTFDELRESIMYSDPAEIDKDVILADIEASLGDREIAPSIAIALGNLLISRLELAAHVMISG